MMSVDIVVATDSKPKGARGDPSVGGAGGVSQVLRIRVPRGGGQVQVPERDDQTRVAEIPRAQDAGARQEEGNAVKNQLQLRSQF